MAIEQRPALTPNSPAVPDVTKQSLTLTIKETIEELKKTTWPTRKEANRLTLVVVGVIIVLGIYMGLLDVILSKIDALFNLT